jgi:hypothetical protein
MTASRSYRAIASWPAVLLAGCLLASPPWAAVARAADPEVFLSWHAPFGFPGATDTLSAACDSSRADTLWLSFDPGAPAPLFAAASATLMFRPAVGDSLPLRWRSGRDVESNPPFIEVKMDPDSTLGYAQAFRVKGIAIGNYDGSGHDARFNFSYATSYAEAGSLAQHPYVLARVVMRRPAPSIAGCGQPICIEWVDFELVRDVKDDLKLKPHGAHRFVSLNSPGGEVSVPYRRAAALRGWSPNLPH